MGLLRGLVSSVFGAPKRRSANNTIYIDASLGNVLLAGNSKSGMEMIMRNYAIDALNNDAAVVLFRDSKNGFSSYPSILNSANQYCEINNEEGAVTEQIDAFACFGETEVNKYLVDMFDQYSEIDKSKRMSYQRYIALIRSLLKKRGKKVKLNELDNYSFDELDTLNATLPMPETERNANQKLLNSFLADSRELEAYFYEFANNTVGEILSGNQTMETIFRRKALIEVSLDFTSKPKESEMLMSVMLDNLCKLNVAAAGKSSVVVIANEIPNEALINAKFYKVIKNSGHCRVLYTVSDIANLVEQSNDWIEYADSYFFFKQNSNENKEFCSAFFGEYERQKETYTSGRTSSSMWDYMRGRGSTSNQRSTSVTTEKERVYLPEVFSSLPDTQAIYYFKSSNEHNYINL